MNRLGRLTGVVFWTILCLAILTTPSRSFAVVRIADDFDDGREEWHGPGDPEGGDRFQEDLISSHLVTQMQSAADVTDPRDTPETAPWIRLVPLGRGYLLIIDTRDSQGASPDPLTR